MKIASFEVTALNVPEEETLARPSDRLAIRNPKFSPTILNGPLVRFQSFKLRIDTMRANSLPGAA